MQQNKQLTKKPLTRLIQGLLLCSTSLGFMALADTYTPPTGVPTPSFANNFVVIDDVANGDDSRTGYGGVDYKYRVSATQITVGDWVDFLNDADPNDTMGFGPIGSGCGNGLCFWAYEHNGSSWSVTGFTDDSMNMSAAEAANLPIDWLSINMVARYMNWLATGDVNSGAFTFSNTTSGNASITSFDPNYPGPRLPLEDEIYKAMFWDGNSNSYNDYPTTNISGGIPVIAAVDASGIHNLNAGGALLPGYFGSRRYAQVGQETGNPWGLFDVTGNRHETTVEPGNLSATVLRGASAFDNPPDGSHSLYSWRDNLDAATRYVSVGYRVWMGVSAPSGTLSITKSVTGGSDPQTFSLQMDCDDDNFDVSNISLADGDTYNSDNIPVGVQCTITETTPTPPNGFTYGAPVISPSTVTIQDGTNVSVSVENPLTPATNCTINTPTVTTQCDDAGTGSDPNDDTFSFTINTTGTDVDNDYTIQTGSDTFSNVPYNSNEGPYGSYLISSGNITLTLTDTADISCQLPNVTVTAPATCSSAPVCTTVTNSASITNVNETDTDTTNHDASASLDVNCANNPEVDLELVKTSDKTNVVAGETVTYTLTLVNRGPDDATSIQVSDQLPTGVTYVSSTPSQGTYDENTGIWNVGDLANQAQATLTINVTID
jgi:uncharacterized repeat protein (TIGR01451 family)